MLSRLLAALVLLAACVAVGALLGGWLFGRAVAGAWLGVPVGVVLLVLLDARRAHRLLQWLRDEERSPAPRDPGHWGELAYRIERALRLRERALHDEQQQLQQFLSAIEASPNGVMLLDAQGQVDWCNAVAADHFGLDAVRDQRQRLTNLVRDPVFVSYLTEENFDEPIVFRAPRGRSTLSVQPRRYGDGQLLLLSQDITETERADAMRRSFVANVSHEIRTPLTVLAGFVDTLADLPLTDEERARVLVLMRQQTDRMQALVADLLTLAQLEGSPRPPADRWLPLAPLLRRPLADAQALSGDRHRLLLDTGDEPVDALELAGVESELLSAIANLLTNAVRYTPPGGRVTLSWRSRPGGGGEIAVQDTGVGIAREHIPRLTERFFRVDGSRSRDTGGTGLGLSIVKHVVQRHGGELLIDSEPGQGSNFRIVLPASRLRRVDLTEPVAADPA